MPEFGLHSNVIQHSKDTTITQNVYNHSGLDSLRTWLCADVRQAPSRRSSVPNRFQDGLTRSITESPEFRLCLEQRSHTLVLQGSMDSGKTTTVRGIIKYLRDWGDILVPHVLFGCHLQTGHDTAKVLLRLLRQVVNLRDLEQRRLVRALYDKYAQECPPADDTAQVLSELIKTRAQPTCIIVDGLDEFSDQDQLCAMLDHLKIVQQRSGCGLLMTGRVREASVEHVFSTYSTRMIYTLVDDIALFIQAYPPSHAIQSLLKRDPKVLAEITETIVRSSNKLFLLAKLNTSYVLRAHTIKRFRDCLSEVRTMTPSTDDMDKVNLVEEVFSPAFDRNIQRTFENGDEPYSRRDADDAKRILAFMRDAARPLMANELRHMLALREHPSEFGSEALRDQHDLTKITFGLMEVNDSGTVNSVHHCLKTHLHRKWQDKLPDANSTLTRLCLKYLSWTCFSKGPCTSKPELNDRLSCYGFLDYAARYWHEHLQHLKVSGMLQEVVRPLKTAVLDFVRDTDKVSCARQVTLLPDPVVEHHNHDIIRCLGQDMVAERSILLFCRGPMTMRPGYTDLYQVGRTSGLHMISLLGMDFVADEYLRGTVSDVISGTNGSNETPLHLAGAHGSTKVAQRLIAAGADLNMQDRDGRSPWHLAVWYGNLAAVGMMLELPAHRLRVNAETAPASWSADCFEISSLQPGIITMRTERAMKGSTALHLAARDGHRAMVQLILDDGRADARLEDEAGMTPFHKACKYGHLDIVILLIKHYGWFPHLASSRDGRTGLHLACKYRSGHPVVQYLLRRFPELCNAVDNNRDTALHHAAAGEDGRNVQLLLDVDSVDVNAMNMDGETPLRIAAFNTNYDILLKDRRIDTHIKLRRVISQDFRQLRRRAIKGSELYRQANGHLLANDGVAHIADGLTALAIQLEETLPRGRTPGT